MSVNTESLTDDLETTSKPAGMEQHPEIGQVEDRRTGADEGLPTSIELQFDYVPGEGNASERLKKAEAWIERVAPILKLVYLSFQNIEREQNKANELWTYRCLGLDPKNKENGGICGMTMRAKRPEFRTYADRLICPNPVHNGDLTPMEPIIAK